MQAKAVTYRDLYRKYIYERQTREKATVTGVLTLKNGTVINLQPEDFVLNSVSIDEVCSEKDGITFGGTFASTATAAIFRKTDRYSLPTNSTYWAELVLTAHFQVPPMDGYQGFDYKVPLGVFYVNEAKKDGKTISFKMMDRMTELDEPLDAAFYEHGIVDGDEKGNRYFTVRTIITNICNKFNFFSGDLYTILYNQDPFKSRVSVSYYPDIGKYEERAYLIEKDGKGAIKTYRDALNFCGILCGGFFYLDRTKIHVIIDGVDYWKPNLRFGYYKSPNTEEGFKPAAIIKKELRTRSDLYDFDCAYSGVAIESFDGQRILRGDGTKLILDLGKTKVKTNNKKVPINESVFDPSTREQDADKWSADSIANNCLIKGLLSGRLTYNPGTIEWPGDPELKCGDVILIKAANPDEQDELFYVMSNRWSSHGSQKLEAYGKNPMLAAAKSIKNSQSSGSFESSSKGYQTSNGLLNMICPMSHTDKNTEILPGHAYGMPFPYFSTDFAPQRIMIDGTLRIRNKSKETVTVGVRVKNNMIQKPRPDNIMCYQLPPCTKENVSWTGETLENCLSVPLSESFKIEPEEANVPLTFDVVVYNMNPKGNTAGVTLELSGFSIIGVDIKQGATRSEQLPAATTLSDGGIEIDGPEQTM